MNRGVRAILAGWLAAPILTFAQNVSYEGLWWNSPANSESGWGLNITHQGSILFATWFTYDRQGNGMWLVLPQANLVPPEYDPYYGTMTGGAIEYQGTVYSTTGPAFDSANFAAAAPVVVNAVGTASVSFVSPNIGTFAYTVDGVTQMKSITRQVFGPMPSCTLGGSAGANPHYQALWWRSPAGSESGWGVNVTHQGDTLFATWFTYDSARRGMWLVMSDGRRTAANTYTGELYRTTGPAFDSSPWNGAQVRATSVGSATFTFSDASNGTFAYNVNGTSQTKAITRQMFSSPATVCR